MKFFKKTWVATALVLIVLTFIANATITSIYVFGSGELMGERKFWEALLHLTIAEIISFGAIGSVIVAFVWFIKGIRKGLKEEETRYGNKHRKNR